MRLYRGDVVLHQGEFALVWEPGYRKLMRIFPIVSPDEYYEEYDLVVQGWREFQLCSAWSVAVVRVTQSRFEWPESWLKLPDVAFDNEDMGRLRLALSRMIADRGLQREWPFLGSADAAKAPIFVS